MEFIKLGNSLTTIGNAAFFGCTALTEIVLPDTVKTIGGGAFENCTSLTSVHLSRTLKKIQSSVFANCVSLTEIYIPDSVTYIANNAFEGIPEITFLCDLYSYATEYALDHQIPIIPTRIGNDEIDSPLNTENSYYIHNYDGLSAAGVMSMVVHYEMQENTLTLDGVLCTNYEYDEETGRLTVPVEVNSGTLRFCMKPLRYEALTSYTRLICTDDKGNTSIALVGTVNSLMPVLNITAREETSASKVAGLTGLGDYANR